MKLGVFTVLFANEPFVDTGDAATVLLRFEDGARGAVIVSQVSPGHKNDLTVHLSGSERSLGWAQEEPERLWLGARDESTLLTRAPSVDGRPVGVPALPAGHPEVGGGAAPGTIIPGHEAAGDVVAIGEGVTDVAVGDRVAIYLALGCGRCAACRRGYLMLCPEWRCLGFDVDGADAEYVVIPACASYILTFAATRH